jgi:hypothetical protein
MHEKDRARVGSQTLECGRCAHCTGKNTEVLNLLRPPWGGTREK